MKRSPHIMIIDPAVRKPELDCFNRMAVDSPVAVTYHLPALFGMDSILRDESGTIGIVILGSSSSVNDRFPWQKELETWLLPWLHKKTPTLGICYGHQMLGAMFGSPVGYLFPDQKKLEGFEKVQLSKNPLWNNQELAGQLYVSHREVVKTCPKGMKVIAHRPHVEIDGLAHDSLPIWSFQTHPEATLAFVRGDEAKRDAEPGQFEFGHGLVRRFLSFAKSHSTKK